MSSYAELRGTQTYRCRVDGEFFCLLAADWFDPSSGVLFSDDEDGHTWEALAWPSQLAQEDDPAEIVHHLVTDGARGEHWVPHIEIEAVEIGDTEPDRNPEV